MNAETGELPCAWALGAGGFWDTSEDPTFEGALGSLRRIDHCYLNSSARWHLVEQEVTCKANLPGHWAQLLTFEIQEGLRVPPRVVKRGR